MTIKLVLRQEIALFMLSAIFFAAVPQPAAADEPCSAPMEKVALDFVGTIDSWEKVQKFQTELQSCDDGAISEGVSDEIVSLFANKWEQFPTFARLAADADFRAFVLRHIDASADPQQLKKVFAHTKQCSSSHSVLCNDLQTAVTRALSECEKR